MVYIHQNDNIGTYGTLNFHHISGVRETKPVNMREAHEKRTKHYPTTFVTVGWY
jgi:hypothetical protein